MPFRKKFFFKIVLFKNAPKTEELRILRGKLNQNLIVCVQSIFSKSAFQK